MKTQNTIHFLYTFSKIIITICFLSLGNNAYAQCNQLVWADEFDNDGLPDAQKWGYDVGGSGWGNNEEQYYTENDTDNARVENGKLIIEAKKENFNGRSYTSARLVSKNKGDWLYGRFEIKAKLPSGRGTWPAIWMLPTDWEYGGWPTSGEIDIMEHVGYDQGTVHGTVHTEAFNHSIGTQKGGSIYLDDASSGFHVYAIEWTEEKIDFFIDDNKYFTFDNTGGDYKEWPFDKRFHFVLNIAVGGNWGGAQGIDETIFPQTMEIDYVRVYSQIEEFNIIGDSYIKPNDTNLIYSVPDVVGGEFQWTVPDGVDIVSGQGTNAIVVNWNDKEGDISVSLQAGTCDELTDVISIKHIETPDQGMYFIDQFDDNLLDNWEGPEAPNTYTLLEENGILKIDYDVSDPDISPHATLTFNNAVDLTEHSLMKIKVKTLNESNSVNIRVDLVDVFGKQTNATPVFNLFPLIDDGEFYTYEYDFDGRWKSDFPSNGATVDAGKIQKLIIYINFGVFGSVGSDIVWIDDISMEIPSNDAKVPNRPSHLTASLNSNAVELNWQDNATTENGFKLWRSENENSGFQLIEENLSSDITTYIDNTVNTNTNYFYRISSYNEVGESDYSNTVSPQTSVTGISTLYNAKINIYPNPVNRFFDIQVPKELVNHQYQGNIYNNTGKLIFSNQLNFTSNKLRIDSSQLLSGTYLLKIYNEKILITKRFFVQ